MTEKDVKVEVTELKDKELDDVAGGVCLTFGGAGASGLGDNKAVFDPNKKVVDANKKVADANKQVQDPTKQVQDPTKEIFKEVSISKAAEDTKIPF